jgi:hypothetical protein
MALAGGGDGDGIAQQNRRMTDISSGAYPMTLPLKKESELVSILSRLSLAPERSGEALALIAGMTGEDREELTAIANCNHVVVRALDPVRAFAAREMRSATSSCEREERSRASHAIQIWAETNLEREKNRIGNAIRFLNEVCTHLESSGCPVCVMKTLDHWPDFGSDLDLITTADEHRVRKAMIEGLHAQLIKPSWGDRLAHKVNFALPGLPEAVEIHVQRLGQTGEQICLARRFLDRRVRKEVGGYAFMAPAPEERIIVATLQRMYRHFFFRISDIVNSAVLVENGSVDFSELRKAADLGGIWPGVCCYLNIVSGYFTRYSGRRLSLPNEVMAAARFGAESTFISARFIRVPVMPHAAGLYTRQVANSAACGNLPAAFRLTLLPPLACAAAVSLRLTGSDKGIW